MEDLLDDSRWRLFSAPSENALPGVSQPCLFQRIRSGYFSARYLFYCMTRQAIRKSRVLNIFPIALWSGVNKRPEGLAQWVTGKLFVIELPPIGLPANPFTGPEALDRQRMSPVMEAHRTYVNKSPLWCGEHDLMRWCVGDDRRTASTKRARTCLTTLV
jgi:hypothetical protein